MLDTETSRLVAEFAAREPAIPGLATLLDPERFLDALGTEAMLEMSEAAMGGAGGLSPATGRCATAVERMQATHRAAARQLG